MEPKFKSGDKVFVGLAYMGGGRYGADGFEGPYTVMSFMEPRDYKLVKGHVSPETLEDCSWDVVINHTRVHSEDPNADAIPGR